jgi:hypothetical protein
MEARKGPDRADRRGARHSHNPDYVKRFQRVREMKNADAARRPAVRGSKSVGAVRSTMVVQAITRFVGRPLVRHV